jgi:probable rRNA maturation factor
MDSESSVVLDGKRTGLNARLLQDFIERARRAAKLRGKISVLVTRDQKMRELNSRFRGKNTATDVLSFPAGAMNGAAGDIAISLNIAARNAGSLGHSVADEIRILILHGILHLAGYDHENDRGEMERKEIALRKKLGLPAGLIERSSDSSFANGGSPLAKEPRSVGSGLRPRTKSRRQSRT